MEAKNDPVNSRSERIFKSIPSTSKDVGKQNDEINKVYNIIKQEYIILAEYKMVQEENIHGIYVIPSRECPLVWYGVVFVRSGPYEDGVFRFTINLDEQFPDSSHPRVIFHSDIFHPVIHPETNELSLKQAFPTWNKNEQHLWQIVKYIQWIFNNIDASMHHGINTEAMEMLTKNETAFKSKCQELIQLSHSHLYDESPTNDKHYISFDPFNPETYEKQKNLLKKQKDCFNKKGYSWVLPKSFKPLERPHSPGMGPE